MNIDKLKELADTVERGVVVFPKLGMVVAFDMSVEFCNIMSVVSVPHRTDVPDPFKVTACGCGIGFAIALFSPLKARLKDRDFLTQTDLYTEACLILDLTREQSKELFFGRMSKHITGADYARVIRNFLLTEKVDWMILNV